MGNFDLDKFLREQRGGDEYSITFAGETIPCPVDVPWHVVEMATRIEGADLSDPKSVTLLQDFMRAYFGKERAEWFENKGLGVIGTMGIIEEVMKPMNEKVLPEDPKAQAARQVVGSRSQSGSETQRESSEASRQISEGTIRLEAVS